MGDDVVHGLIITFTTNKISIEHIYGSTYKVVIYNYVFCWLYFMTKSVVIALILFLVFYGILLYWV